MSVGGGITAAAATRRRRRSCNHHTSHARPASAGALLSMLFRSALFVIRFSLLRVRNLGKPTLNLRRNYYWLAGHRFVWRQQRSSDPPNDRIQTSVKRLHI